MSDGARASGEIKAGSEFRIAPSDPGLHRFLTRLLVTSGFDARVLLERVRECTSDESVPPSVRFLSSVLIDLDSWGASIEIDQSQLFVTVPAVSAGLATENDRARLRSALERLRGDVRQYVSAVDLQGAASVVCSGRFGLERVEPESRFLTETFRTGVTTWSMPYRPREGRSTRYVLTADVEGQRIGAGLLEIGDDAPRNPPRDRLMGVATDIKDLSRDEVALLGDRFRSLRNALLPEHLPREYRDTVEVLARMLDQIVAAGKGRSGTAVEISSKKRLTYLARLVKAELACAGLAGGSFGEGLRVLRDLTVPRTNVEMTVCGALPPFGPLLVGKLVASMACHPDVRRFVDRDFGEITRGLFDVSALEALLPRHGALIVTTRGLYPAHSAQYNGVECPGREGRRVPLKKLGDTEGQTASHLSDLTVRSAVAVNEAMGGMEVSRVFGAGGAKRQRIISEALRKTGLPLGLGHASIGRPVYGVSLVKNLEQVVLLNAEPLWVAEPYIEMSDPGHYIEHAVGWWRARWSRQLANRLEAPHDG